MSDKTGIQSQMDVNENSTVGMKPTNPSTWSWIWFVLAVLVIAGFHIRVFGQVIPPTANLP